ncbi:type II secretion system F family protein, partial [Bdellovibrionales bacterium]|nr:type II secretion system F family protein [Bdellovibrionales bacterium]
LGNGFIVIPLFGISVFIISYLWANKVVHFLERKSLGGREEVIEIMDKMMLDVNKKKITLALLVGSFGLGLLFFLALWPNIIVGAVLATAITIAGWSAPSLIMRALWEKRCNRVVNQLVDGLTIMANGVGAGLSVTQSMERVCINMKGPLVQEFQLILNKIRIGMSIEEAFIEFGERVPRQDVTMLVTGTNILKETGGNLAETFQTIVSTVRERQKIEKKIEALTAQGIMQGIIVTLVPFVLLVVFFVVDPNYIMPLFTRPLGWFALAIMLALQVTGGVMMKKVVTIKV